MGKNGTKTPYSSTRVILLEDSALSVLASLFSIMLIRWLSGPTPEFSTTVLLWTLASLFGSTLGFILFKCHKVVRRHASVRSLARIVGAVGVKLFIMCLVQLVGLVEFPDLTCSILAVLVDMIITGVALFWVRTSARIYSETMGLNASQLKIQAAKKSALVAGTEEGSLLLAHSLEKEGYDVLGLLTSDPHLSGRVIADKLVFLCKNEKDLERLQWQLGGVDCVFFPPQVRLSQEDDSQEEIQPQQDGMSLMGHVFKRSFDIILSSLLLLVFSPVIGICAWLIHREDGGPVLYKQERIGRGGAPFTIYKFRSMQMDAEKNGAPALYAGDDDERLTRVGRFLRIHHLDELPQLWNVLKGDMSFIGYRPERKYFIDKIMERNARYRYLYQIRPGVTSYATLYNGYTDTLEKMLTRLDMDLYYLRNHSVWFDAKVLGLTFLSIVSGKKF